MQLDALWAVLAVFSISVSLYGYFSPHSRVRGEKAVLYPGLTGVAAFVILSSRRFIPHGLQVGWKGFLVFGLPLLPLLTWWGYFMLRELMALKQRLQR